MPDVEKVISDLEEQITWIRDNDFHKFPGWGHAVLAMRDAIAMLKAQEPRVMTLEEIESAFEKQEPVWLDVKGVPVSNYIVIGYRLMHKTKKRP